MERTRFALLTLFLLPFYAFASVPGPLQDRVVGQSFIMPSKVLQAERKIELYLPQNYEQSTRHYPVVVVLDSNYLFDLTIATLRNRWQRGIAPQSIIVGIQARDATERFNYATPLQRMNSDALVFETAQPQKMAQFIQQELLAFIEENYRTQGHRTIIGMSPTATNVVFDYLNDDPLFNAHIALAADFLVTPSFNHSKIPLAEEITRRAANKPGFAFFSLASDDAKTQPGRAAPFDALGTQQHQRMNVHAFIAADTEHYQQAALSLERAFSLLYPIDVWRPDYRSLWEKGSKPTKYLEAFYEALDARYQMKTYPLVEGYWMVDSVVGLVGMLSNQQRHDDALSVLQWANRLLPGNLALLQRLAQQSLERGEKHQAKRYVDMGLKVAREHGLPMEKVFAELNTLIESK